MHTLVPSRRRRRYRGAASLWLLALPWACGGRSAWTPVPSAALDAGQQARRAVATDARDALDADLERALEREWHTGAERAQAVCAQQVPAIAAGIAVRHGVRIGRTAGAPRAGDPSPDEAPDAAPSDAATGPTALPEDAIPAWARALLAQRPADARFAVGPHGELGAVLPIRLADSCLRCHGTARAVEPAPRATGLAAGDLVGWFWVEVP